MNLLSIDTSTDLASVALLCDGLVHEKKQANHKTHAEFILPMISELMVLTALSFKQLNGILFSCGPGSFTGIRIACSVAKGLACAHELPLIPVSTLGAIAFAARQQDESLPVLAVIDARMQEWYWAYFDCYEHSAPEQVSPAKAIVLPEDKPFILAGLGIDLCETELQTQVQSQIKDRHMQYPDATTMIHFALDTAIKPISAAQAQPVYVRNQVIQGDANG